MLRRRFYVPSAIVSYGATTFSAVHEAAFEREVGRHRAVQLRDEILELNSEG
jgi:hypothetical protein